MNRLIRKHADAPPAPAADVVLLQEIRDILKSQKSVP
jgi:large-conductance mechanosensitive channel